MKNKNFLLIIAITVCVIFVFFLRRIKLNQGLQFTTASEQEIEGDKPESGEPISHDENDNQTLDYTQYFQNNSKIIEEIEVKNSNNTFSELEVIQEMGSRGFTEYPILSEYDINGNFSEIEASDSSTEKHPVYSTYYYTDDNKLWSILVIDGEIMAIPVSYLLDLNDYKQIIVSESEAVTSYDNNTNKYIKNIPDKTIMKVIVINKITPEALDALDIGEAME